MLSRIVLVAPLVGAWIEITGCLLQANTHPVAPLVGAWIEIFSYDDNSKVWGRSLPLCKAEDYAKEEPAFLINNRFCLDLLCIVFCLLLLQLR